MALMPSDVQSQTFREKYKGYDVDEVDQFLDEVTERLTELISENEQLTLRVGELELDREPGTASPTPAPGPAAQAAAPGDGLDPELLQRTLLTAQRAADQALADAQAEADDVLSRAHAEAERMVTDAERAAADRAERMRGDASQVAQAVEDLRRFRNEYRERVQGVIAEHLALLDQAGDLPEVPTEIEEAAAVVQQHAAAAVGEGDTDDADDDDESPWTRSP
jgi:cell division initiation protein